MRGEKPRTSNFQTPQTTFWWPLNNPQKRGSHTTHTIHRWSSHPPISLKNTTTNPQNKNKKKEHFWRPGIVVTSGHPAWRGRGTSSCGFFNLTRPGDLSFARRCHKKNGHVRDSVSWNAVGHRLVGTHYVWIFLFCLGAIDRFLKEADWWAWVIFSWDYYYWRALCYLSGNELIIMRMGVVRMDGDFHRKNGKWISGYVSEVYLYRGRDLKFYKGMFFLDSFIEIKYEQTNLNYWFIEIIDTT